MPTSRYSDLLSNLRRTPCFGVAVLCWLLLASMSSADEDLHVTINRLLAKQRVGPSQPLCSDSEFARRLYLDVLGRIPSADETRAFFENKAENKREQLVDQLLVHPRYAHHMANVFDVMMMERRADKHVKAAEWKSYLLASVQVNKPYNQLASEILGADGADKKLRGAAKFYLDRDLGVDVLTRDVGRVFFGMDLECAQCHDHPLVADYYQADYYGIYAFLSGNYLFQPDKKKPAVIGEKVAGEAKFKSVFTEVEGMTRPKLPGEVQLDLPTFAKGDEYKTAPDDKKKVRGVPKFSRRERLAELTANGTNRAFSRNIANRLWAHMMGRGLVHPVDLHHSDNSPSHPELLEALTTALPSMNYDTKAFIRQVALSDAYQRPFALPSDLDAFVAAAAPLREPTEKEVAARAAQLEQLEERLIELDNELSASAEQAAKLRTVKIAAEQAAATATKQLETAKAVVAKQTADHVSKAATSTKLTDAATKATEVAALTPKDTELKKAADVLTAKAAELTKQTVVAKAAMDTAMKALPPLDKAVAATGAALSKATAAWAPAEADSQAKRASMQTQHALVDTERTALTSKKRQLEQIERLLAWRDQRANLVASVAKIEAVRTRIAAAEKAVATASEATQQEQVRVAQAKAESTRAIASLAALLKQQTDKMTATKLLQTSLAQAKEAEPKLTDKETVGSAIKTLEASITTATKEVESLGKEVNASQATMKQAAEKVQAAEAALAPKLVAEKQAVAALQTTKAALVASQTEQQRQQSAVDSAYDELAAVWTDQLEVSTLAPLTPEQLAWSVFQATGVVDAQHRAAEAELAKKQAKDKTELGEEQKRQQVQEAVLTKLAGNVAKFTKLFAASAGQPQGDFFATVDQALFFANGGDLQSWTNPAGGNLTDRLAKMEDVNALAEELYISVMTRRPNDQERQQVADYLSARTSDKPKAIQEMVWALITSAEFRFQR